MNETAKAPLKKENNYELPLIMLSEGKRFRKKSQKSRFCRFLKRSSDFERLIFLRKAKKISLTTGSGLKLMVNCKTDMLT